MKHKSFTTLFLSAALLIGALTPFILLSKNEVVEVSAAQHKDNFDEYIYNGNYYDSSATSSIAFRMRAAAPP